jgi:DNA repair protein RecO (recombination protein O)
MQRIASEPAFLLHSWAYRENSEILALFTRNHGVQNAVVRSRRGSKQGRLLQGRRYQVAMSGRGELLQLTQADFDSDATSVVPQGPAVLSVLYLSELLHALLHRGETHEALFDALHSVLSIIGQSTAPLAQAWALRRFEWLLLSELGYGLSADFDIDGESIDTDSRYWVDPEAGFFRVFDAELMAIRGSALTALADASVDLSEASAEREARELMRFLLEHRLHGKTIRSWQFAQNLGTMKRSLSDALS